MPLSMTGFGEAHQQHEALTVRVELRAVNNRHLKLTCRLPEGYAGQESRLEAIVREHVRRGSVQLNLYIDRGLAAEDYRINTSLLLRYYEQLAAVNASLHESRDIHLADLVGLPGVITEAKPDDVDVEQEWPLVESTVQLALEQLNGMREQEGAALAADLHANCQTIAAELDQIQDRAPEVVKAYEVRLLERINQLLAEHDLQADPSSVIREVGVFADRVDLAEEIVRLRSHLQQFDEILRSERSAGRKLEFLIQELLRETNTIGSKGNDAQIARHVVQIKAHIERLREMIQNVE